MAACAALLAAACGSDVSREDVVAARRLGAGGGALDVGAGTGTDAATGGAGTGGTGTGGPGTGEGAAATGAGTGGAAAQPVAEGREASDVGVTPDTIVLGNVSSLSGPLQTYQVPVHALDAMIREVNAAGGVHGRKLVLKVVDDGLDPGRNAAGFRQLADQVFAFVGSTSLADAGGAAVVKEKAVPDFGFALSPQRAANPTHVRNGQEAGRDGKVDAIARFAKSIGVKRFGFVYLAADAARIEARFVRKTFEAEGLEICYDQEAQLVEPSYTTYIVQMRQNNCDGFYLVFDINGEAKFQRDMNRQGWKPLMPLYNVTAYQSNFPALVGGGPEQVEGIYVTFGHALVTDPVPGVQRLVRALKKYYPNDDPTVYPTIDTAADFVVFQKALEASGPNPTRKRLLEEVAKLSNYDSDGLVPPFPNPLSDEPPKCLLILRMRAGKWERAMPAAGSGQRFECAGRIIK